MTMNFTEVKVHHQPRKQAQQDVEHVLEYMDNSVANFDFMKYLQK